MNPSTNDIDAGAMNLLLNCAQAKAGDHILIVGEDTADSYFDSELCDDIARVAQQLGMQSKVVLAKPVVDANQFPSLVSDAMLQADKTIFFSRLGDQVRFLATPGNSQKVMCYTLTREHLASPFAIINYNSLKRMHDALKKIIINSTIYRIDADCGTSLTSQMASSSDSSQLAVAEFSLDLFPVMIFPPVHFNQLSGQLVLRDFLLSSSTRQYSDSVLRIESPVVANIENSHIIDFEGDQIQIKKIKSQLERAAKITGGDAYQLNSWHTGINPYTFFKGDPYADLEKWSTVAYGSPRYTHVHCAGMDPGDISIQLFDASISFDDCLIWDKGRFVFLDRPEVQALFNESERAMFNSSLVLDIGM
jgi:hypothetical protein